MNKEEIKKRYSILPKEIKDVYDDPEILDVIYDICQKHGVNHLDQVGVVDDAVYELILGLIKPTDFVKKIVADGGIGEDIANLITHDINEQILHPIREQLVAHHKSLEHGPLPSNVEREETGFSSVPYQEPKESVAQNNLIKEIENPVPATYITRDIFEIKKNNLHASEKLAEKIELKSPETKPVEQKTTPNPVPTEPKKDPYREEI